MNEVTLAESILPFSSSSGVKYYQIKYETCTIDSSISYNHISWRRATKIPSWITIVIMEVYWTH